MSNDLPNRRGRLKNIYLLLECVIRYTCSSCGTHTPSCRYTDNLLLSIRRKSESLQDISSILTVSYGYGSFGFHKDKHSIRIPVHFQSPILSERAYSALAQPDSVTPYQRIAFQRQAHHIVVDIGDACGLF